MRDPWFREAVERRAAARAEYEDVLLAAYVAAEDATRGALLNRRGRERGIDPWRLFRSNHTYAYAYASEELVEWWRSHPRPTFARYAAQRYAADEYDEYAA